MISVEWAKVKQPEPAWYWICDAAHFGDLYQVCAFAEPFRDYHGWQFPLYVIATSRAQADIAALFGPCFDKVIVAPGLQASADDWSQFYAEGGLPAFGLDTPVIVFPVLNPANTGMWEFTVDQNSLSVLPLIRRMLHLPSHIEPCPPRPDADRQTEAVALCEQAGMIQGRSVVLCPYARSDVADATSGFTLLAQVLERAGYAVFTSIAGGEQLIEGTVSITIPFSVLPDVANYAGWVVAVRSGVADVVSSAACRKSIIYQSFNTLRNWGLSVLGLCRDAHELVFRFGSEAPERFADAVIGGVSHGGRPRRLGISEDLRPVRSVSFSDLDRASMSDFLRPTWFAKSGVVLRITDLPSRCRDQASRRALLVLLARQAGSKGWRFFACHDGFAWDFYEPVDLAALIDGQYYWAGFWHTILLVDRPHLTVRALPAAVLPDACIAFGVDARPADALGSPVYGERLTGRIPFCHGGLQFLDGWSHLENWGIWSVSCLSTLKVLLPVAPPGQLTVRLVATVAAFSSRMPVIAFSATANGIEVGQFELPGAASPHVVEFMIPRHAVVSRKSVMLRFKFPYVLSPSQQDIGSADLRTISLGLHRLRIDLC